MRLISVAEKHETTCLLELQEGAGGLVHLNIRINGSPSTRIASLLIEKDQLVLARYGMQTDRMKWHVGD